MGDRLIEGFWLIALGSFKKLVLADRLAQPVNLIFENLTYAGSVDLWLAIFAYGLQIYLDFSGYTDIARGSALLLGIWLPENFDAPYLSTSIADFWRRWHMTLGRWLREYLYIPLGGSRKGLIRTCFNLLIVMILAGLWHGAAWGFLVWGAIHGLALAVQRINQAVRSQWDIYNQFWTLSIAPVLAWLLTLMVVQFGWIFFRLPQPQDFGWVIQHLWDWNGNPQFITKVYSEGLGIGQNSLALILALMYGAIALLENIFKKKSIQSMAVLRLTTTFPLVYATVTLSPDIAGRYVYFNF